LRLILQLVSRLCVQGESHLSGGHLGSVWVCVGYPIGVKVRTFELKILVPNWVLFHSLEVKNSVFQNKNGVE
jgi:hypothetical protein